MKRSTISRIAILFLILAAGYKWYSYEMENKSYRSIAQSMFMAYDSFDIIDKSFESEFYEKRFDDGYRITRRTSYERKLGFVKLLEYDLETHTFTIADTLKAGSYRNYEFNLYYNYESGILKASEFVSMKENKKDWQRVSTDTIDLSTFREKIQRYKFLLLGDFKGNQ